MDLDRGFKNNIDIAFKLAFYIELPLIPFAFYFDTPVLEEEQKIKDCLGLHLYPETNIYVLASGKLRYLVAARGVSIEENDLELSESSLKHWGDCE